MNRERRFTIQFSIGLVGLIFLIKLFVIQVLDENYKLAAENNSLKRIIEEPFRGLIHDRHGELIVYNEPVYDLMVVPQEVLIRDTAVFSQLLGLEEEELLARLAKARQYHSIKPSRIMEQIPMEDFNRIQDRLIDYRGFFIRPRTVRRYPDSILSSGLGYVAEISKRQLQRDTTGHYKQGDYVGISGVESQYENDLRGTPGVRYKIVDVMGIEKGDFNDGEWDTLSTAGSDLTLSIDREIQQYAEKLMKGKVGSVVAIEPATGEILAMVSAPVYDPNLLTGRDFGKHFLELQDDSLKPLFNRPIMATYPPGSIFKILQSLIALQEGVITTNEQIYCSGQLIGDHAPPGYYDLHKGIVHSSNNYFFQVFRRIINQGFSDNTFMDSREGLKIWKKYTENFGLGTKLEFDLPNEKTGFVPGTDYYDGVYGYGRWKFSTIASLSIGQGEILLNPIQMANLGAIMANRGFYYPPHIVRSVNTGGVEKKVEYEKVETGIDAEHYPAVIDAMADALAGTAPRAIIRDIQVCGKTGTAENPHGEDHSVFMAFAPKDDPKIAISVYVENAGWGGRAAGGTASLIIEKYLRGEITRPWLEEYILKGEFIY